ncbi:MAG: family transcriptional regulator [Thermoleophilia bacterium]|nr:family transcriptional regulator [Thermoleophilia bacterium]
MEANPLVHSEERVRIGERIQLYRECLGWTRDELGRRARRSRSYISKLENGKADPTLTTLLLIADALGVELQRLMPPISGAFYSDGGFVDSMRERREEIERDAETRIAAARLETQAARRAAARARRAP